MERTIQEKIDLLVELREKLETRTDITREEYKEFKQVYDINIEYWTSQLENN